MVLHDMATAEAAALRTALGELVAVKDAWWSEVAKGTLAQGEAWQRRDRAALDTARAALAGARPEATEGADDPVRRSSARPEEGP